MTRSLPLHSPRPRQTVNARLCEMPARAWERWTGTPAVLGSLPGLLAVGFLLLGGALGRALGRETKTRPPSGTCTEGSPEPLPGLPSSPDTGPEPENRSHLSALGRHPERRPRAPGISTAGRAPSHGHAGPPGAGCGLAGSCPLPPEGSSSSLSGGQGTERLRPVPSHSTQFLWSVVTGSLGTTEGLFLRSLAAIGGSLREGTPGLGTALDPGTRGQVTVRPWWRLASAPPSPALGVSQSHRPEVPPAHCGPLAASMDLVSPRHPGRPLAMPSPYCTRVLLTLVAKHRHPAPTVLESIVNCTTPSA